MSYHSYRIMEPSENVDRLMEELGLIKGECHHFDVLRYESSHGVAYVFTNQRNRYIDVDFNFTDSAQGVVERDRVLFRLKALKPVAEETD